MKTPSQTVGPFYTIGLSRSPQNELADLNDPAAIRLVGRLLDGQDEPISDGMVEAWDPAGERWGRSGTDAEGRFSFVLTKPDALPGEAPRLDVYVFARGLLRHQLTRVYFPGEAANETDPVLSGLDEDERATLVATEEGGALRFDIRMQGGDRLLRALTTFAALFVPGPLREAVSDQAWLGRCSTPSARSARTRTSSTRPSTTSRRCARRAGRTRARSCRSRARCASASRTRTARRRARTSSTPRRCWSRRARASSILADLDGVCAACAGLAETHRSTPMIARTLLQQAVPTTFGLKAAGWLVGLVDARRRLAAVRSARAARRAGGDARSRR